jgi:hypothetical protein
MYFGSTWLTELTCAVSGSRCKFLGILKQTKVCGGAEGQFVSIWPLAKREFDTVFRFCATKIQFGVMSKADGRNI